MISPSVARAFHAVLAVVGLTALIIQLTLTVRGIDVLVPDGKEMAGTAQRVLRFFSYFTIESNVLVIVTSAILAFRPAMDAPLWRVARLDALIGITVTGIVYAIVLAPIVNLDGLSGLTDTVFHYIVPIMAVVGWVLFGPRPQIAVRTIMLGLIWPAVYIVWVGILGAWTGWYPYPFTDVGTLGYFRVILNGLLIVLLILAVGFLYRWLDRKLPAFPRDRV